MRVIFFKDIAVVVVVDDVGLNLGFVVEKVVVTFAVVGVGVGVGISDGGGGVDTKKKHSKAFPTQNKKKMLNSGMPQDWNILNSEVKKFPK